MTITVASSANMKRTAAWTAIGVFALFFIYEIRAILPPFVIGMLAAYFVDPAVNRLHKLGLSRGLATVIILALFFGAVTLALVVIVPVLVHQFSDLAEAIPDYISDLNLRYGGQFEQWTSYFAPHSTTDIKGAAGETATMVLHSAGGVLAAAFASGIALLNVVALLLITPLVAFYFLRDWHIMMAHMDTLLPRTSADTIRAQLRRIDETLAGFLRGQINVCLILAVFYGVLLSAVGLKFGLVLGIASGILIILPYVGVMSMFLVAMLIGVIQFGFTQHLLMVAGVYGVGQFIEGYFLTPRLVGERVGLHPLWIIFGMLAGGSLFGFAGVLLAVPATAVIGVLTRFATERYLRSPLYHGV